MTRANRLVLVVLDVSSLLMLHASSQLSAQQSGPYCHGLRHSHVATPLITDDGGSIQSAPDWHMPTVQWRIAAKWMGESITMGMW